MILIAPVLLALFALIVDGSYVFYAAAAIRSGAAEGGMAAQIWHSNSTISCVDAVNAAVDGATEYIDHTVTVSSNCTNNLSDRIPSNAVVEVKVISRHTPLISMAFFETPLWFPLEADIKVNHQ